MIILMMIDGDYDEGFRPEAHIANKQRTCFHFEVTDFNSYLHRRDFGCKSINGFLMKLCSNKFMLVLMTQKKGGVGETG